jgi:predicted enzyme related to lactoylglutathione lyase
VSLWQPRSRFGATLVNDIGAPCWNELATTDVGRAKTFFAELLGWEYQTDDGGYVWIRNVGSLNGGMREQTEQERGIPPNRLPYFAVEDADEAARQAAQLGGRRLLPTIEIHLGRFAGIADLQGALFAVFERRDRPITAWRHQTPPSVAPPWAASLTLRKRHSRWCAGVIQRRLALGRRGPHLARNPGVRLPREELGQHRRQHVHLHVVADALELAQLCVRQHLRQRL